MLAHLAARYGVTTCLASVEADNVRSIELLRRLAFRAATACELEAHALSPNERLFVRKLSDAKWQNSSGTR
jgi:hypothetical protein